MKIAPLKCPQCGSTRVIKTGSFKFPKISCNNCNRATKASGRIESYDGNWWPNKARDPLFDTGDYLEHLIDNKE